MRLDYQILLKSPLTLLTLPAPAVSFTDIFFVCYTYWGYFWHNKGMRKKIFEKRKKWPDNRKTSRHVKFGDECSFWKRDIANTNLAGMFACNLEQFLESTG